MGAIKIDSRYKKLAQVLDEALLRAMRGKGHERHGSKDDFDQQISARITREEGDGYILGQVRKKLDEQKGLDYPEAIEECLDCIVLLGLKVILLKEEIE